MLIGERKSETGRSVSHPRGLLLAVFPGKNLVLGARRPSGVHRARTLGVHHTLARPSRLKKEKITWLRQPFRPPFLEVPPGLDKQR
jgi:hypothetical protein